MSKQVASNMLLSTPPKATRFPPGCTLGAIVGDIIGSVYENDPTKDAGFAPLFHPRGRATDDTILTVATMEALLRSRTSPSGTTSRDYAAAYREFGRRHPDAGYGAAFSRWTRQRDDDAGPYGSWGNGAAMRASPIGWACDGRAAVLAAARASAAATHDHPEGIRGAQAAALAVYLARTGTSKEGIRRDLEETFGYDLSSRTVDEIRPTYKFEVSCQKSVPESLLCFLESDSVESAARLAVSLGGDADTQACIACGIAEAFYGPLDADLMESEVRPRLSRDLLCVVDDFGREMALPRTKRDADAGECEKEPRVRCYLLPPGAPSPAVAALAPNSYRKRKTVYLVRHGKSEHNRAADEVGDAAYEDEAYYDAQLVEEGISQAARVGTRLRNKGIQCIVSSPLTRCLQTASIAAANDVKGLGGHGTRRVVLEHLRESGKYGCHPCNRRRPKEEVALEFPIFGFEEVAPGADTVLAEEDGKDGDGAMVQVRGQKLLNWLAGQPEDTFAVFSHCVFLQQLLDEVLDRQPCSKNWTGEAAGYDGGTSWFKQGQVQGFVLVW